MQTSLIISIYDKIEYLKIVLAGCETQTEKNFEIVLADDGSNFETVSEIEALSRKIKIPVKHVRQEDRGFRKNRILNEAIKASSGDYLIFIDGDCVPHPAFVREHLEYAGKKVCLTGRRVNLSKEFTNLLTPEKIKNKFIEKYFYKLIIDGVFGKSFDVEKGIYLKNEFLRKEINKKKRGILGCNFSLFKEDMLAINGFDKRYEAPSVGEDSDVQFRLELNGVEIKSLNNIAVQYHLYHKLQPRPEENLLLFEKIKKENKAFTPFGIERENI
ncbi:MAG: glycosyltransferase [Chlorobi bacterium]|nr:glycosyltransferase [Chlorobiota bacterium]